MTLTDATYTQQRTAVNMFAGTPTNASTPRQICAPNTSTAPRGFAGIARQRPRGNRSGITPVNTALTPQRTPSACLDSPYDPMIPTPPAPKRLSDPVADFPLRPIHHGTAMTTVKVGPKQQSFVIHKNLLCSQSEYFAKALSGEFMEAQTQELVLADDSALAFRVLYTWLYSGQLLLNTLFAGSRDTRDFLWLQTYRLATMRLVSKLQEEAYYQLTGIFNKSAWNVPSAEFIEDLYQSADDIDQCGQIREYVVKHTAWRIAKVKPCKWADWEACLAASTNFAAAVAMQMTKMHSTDPTYNVSHPEDEEKLSIFNAAWTNGDPGVAAAILKRKRDESGEQSLPESKREMLSAPANQVLESDPGISAVEPSPGILSSTTNSTAIVRSA